MWLCCICAVAPVAGDTIPTTTIIQHPTPPHYILPHFPPCVVSVCLVVVVVVFCLCVPCVSSVVVCWDMIVDPSWISMQHDDSKKRHWAPTTSGSGTTSSHHHIRPGNNFRDILLALAWIIVCFFVVFWVLFCFVCGVWGCFVSPPFHHTQLYLHSGCWQQQTQQTTNNKLNTEWGIESNRIEKIIHSQVRSGRGRTGWGIHFIHSFINHRHLQEAKGGGKVLVLGLLDK